jgi:hypothetical protein
MARTKLLFYLKLISSFYDVCDVTSQTSYSPEYTTPTQKKNLHFNLSLLVLVYIIFLLRAPLKITLASGPPD